MSQNFKLKEGATVRDRLPKSKGYHTNETLTDEIALNILAFNPGYKEHFENLPADWEKQAAAHKTKVEAMYKEAGIVLIPSPALEAKKLEKAAMTTGSNQKDANVVINDEKKPAPEKKQQDK